MVRPYFISLFDHISSQQEEIQTQDSCIQHQILEEAILQRLFTS